jgi:hypothetical protein
MTIKFLCNRDYGFITGMRANIEYAVVLEKQVLPFDSGKGALDDRLIVQLD